jgi:hypothetical protein
LPVQFVNLKCFAGFCSIVDSPRGRDMALTVAALSGSLRKDSYDTKLARAFQKLAPADVTMRH